MTTIIAVENSDHVLIGYDSQSTSGHRGESLNTPKIIKTEHYRIAVAGRLKMLLALKHSKLPQPPRDTSEEKTDQFVSNILGPFISLLEKESNCEAGESVYIVVLNKRVYRIDSDGAYLRNNSGKYVIGSGSSYALGSLFDKQEPTELDIKTALRAAAKNDIHTGGPFFVERI